MPLMTTTCRAPLAGAETGLLAAPVTPRCAPPCSSEALTCECSTYDLRYGCRLRTDDTRQHTSKHARCTRSANRAGPIEAPSAGAWSNVEDARAVGNKRT